MLSLKLSTDIDKLTAIPAISQSMDSVTRQATATKSIPRFTWSTRPHMMASHGNDGSHHRTGRSHHSSRAVGALWAVGAVWSMGAVWAMRRSRRVLMTHETGATGTHHGVGNEWRRAGTRHDQLLRNGHAWRTA